MRDHSRSRRLRLTHERCCEYLTYAILRDTLDKYTDSLTVFAVTQTCSETSNADTERRITSPSYLVEQRASRNSLYRARGSFVLFGLYIHYIKRYRTFSPIRFSFVVVAP